MINEFQPNPDGSDPANVEIELKGAPGAAFSGWLTSIESDPPSPGVIDRSTAVSGTYDANGLAVVSIPDLENPTFTFVFSSADGGGVGTDYDTDDDGTADVSLAAFGTIFDAISVSDTTDDPVYGVQFGGIDFPFSGAEPELMFRDGASTEWFAVNNNITPSDNVVAEDGSLLPLSAFSFSPTPDTFGRLNPTSIPEPGTVVLALLSVASAGAVSMRSRLG